MCSISKLIHLSVHSTAEFRLMQPTENVCEELGKYFTPYAGQAKDLESTLPDSTPNSVDMASNSSQPAPVVVLIAHNTPNATAPPTKPTVAVRPQPAAVQLAHDIPNATAPPTKPIVADGSQLQIPSSSWAIQTASNQLTLLKQQFGKSTGKSRNVKQRPSDFDRYLVRRQHVRSSAKKTRYTEDTSDDDEAADPNYGRPKRRSRTPKKSSSRTRGKRSASAASSSALETTDDEQDPLRLGDDFPMPPANIPTSRHKKRCSTPGTHLASYDQMDPIRLHAKVRDASPKGRRNDAAAVVQSIDIEQRDPLQLPDMPIKRKRGRPSKAEVESRARAFAETDTSSAFPDTTDDEGLWSAPIPPKRARKSKKSTSPRKSAARKAAPIVQNAVTLQLQDSRRRSKVVTSLDASNWSSTFLPPKLDRLDLSPRVLLRRIPVDWIQTLPDGLHPMKPMKRCTVRLSKLVLPLEHASKEIVTKSTPRISFAVSPKPDTSMLLIPMYSSTPIFKKLKAPPPKNPQIVKRVRTVAKKPPPLNVSAFEFVPTDTADIETPEDAVAEPTTTEQPLLVSTYSPITSPISSKASSPTPVVDTIDARPATPPAEPLVEVPAVSTPPQQIVEIGNPSDEISKQDQTSFDENDEEVSQYMQGKSLVYHSSDEDMLSSSGRQSTADEIGGESEDNMSKPTSSTPAKAATPAAPVTPATSTTPADPITSPSAITSTETDSVYGPELAPDVEVNIGNSGHVSPVHPDEIKSAPATPTPTESGNDNDELTVEALESPEYELITGAGTPRSELELCAKIKTRSVKPVDAVTLSVADVTSSVEDLHRLSSLPAVSTEAVDDKVINNGTESVPIGDDGDGDGDGARLTTAKDTNITSTIATGDSRDRLDRPATIKTTMLKTLGISLRRKTYGVPNDDAVQSGKQTF